VHNIDNALGLDFASEYQIHELIFINSGSNYYVRLRVDQHAALISDNNSGKTSSLSALKLFLLPDTTFKNQKKKFGFHSGGSYYQDLSSYTYYFPGSESYIICNASNPKGNFCWVLHRTTDLGYERIAVPEEYNTFEHLFWNADSKKNESAGALHADIGHATIKKKLITDYKAKVFNDRKTIGEAIYSRTSSANDESRYCLFPMSKGYSSSSTETIRSLLGMAFSLGNASTTSLPKAIGAILDGAGMSAVKKNNEEGILIDLESQLDEWKALKREDTRLKLIESQKDNFNYLKEARSEYARQRREAIDLFKALVWSIQLGESTLEKQRDTYKHEVLNLESDRKSLEPVHTDLRDKYYHVKSEHKSAINLLNKAISSIKAVNECRARLSPLCDEGDRTDSALLLIIQDQIQDCETEISGLRSHATAMVKMNETHERIIKNRQHLKQLKCNYEQFDAETSLFNTIIPASASVLQSLNNDFSKLSLTPTLEQKTAIEVFTGMFTPVDGSLLFCGQTLASTQYRTFDNEVLKQQLEKDIDDLILNIEHDENQLIKLKNNNNMTAEQQAYKLKESEQELRDFTNQKNALNGASLLNSQKLEAEGNIERLKALYERTESEFNIVSEQRQEIIAKLNKAKESLSNAEAPLTQLSNLTFRLRNIEASSNRTLDIEWARSEYDEGNAQDRSVGEIDNQLNKLDLLMNSALAKRKDCVDSLNLLLEHKLIESTPEDRHQLTVNRDFFEEIYAALQTLFINLDQTKEKYKQTLSNHNNTAAVAARIIENIEGVITNFIKKINEEIKGYKISNLSSVTLVADLHPQYTDMTKTLSRIGGRTDQLLSESFYDQISNFQNNFYNKQSCKVEIDKIIEKIRYQFKRNDTLEDTPQSNGTNSMINSVLLALLLQRLVPNDLKLSMPVVFDEVGSLDQKNFQEILKVMEDHNLYLFVANPEQNGVIASVLDVYHNLSLFKATDVGVLNKAEAIYYPGMEERLVDFTCAETD
jgi:DNA repair exonuclease SbcCD ATPase subunit